LRHEVRLRFQFWQSRKDAGAKPAPADNKINALKSQLDGMRERFGSRLREDYAVLTQFERGNQPPTQNVMGIVHKMAGTAGMLGYDEISEAAGSLDDAFAEPGADTAARLQKLLLVLETTIAAEGKQAKPA
jgi:HPt (histidine-containing phosphotransfer) domain-containing protein